VRAESAQRVIDLLEGNLAQSWGIDHNFITLGDKIRAYAFVPGMTFQRDGQSNIGTGMTLFSHFTKMGPYVWQPRSMHDFDPDKFNWAEAFR